MHEDTKAEILESCPGLSEVANKAAKHLPPGYSIIIEIENCGYDVQLRTPRNGCHSINWIGEGIVSDVNEAICIANGFGTLPHHP